MSAQNNNYLPNRVSEYENLYGMLQNFAGTGGSLLSDLVKMFELDTMMQEEKLHSPDTYAAERLFLGSFVTVEMERDFPLIARDFYTHEYGNLDRYENGKYFDRSNGDEWPSSLFCQFTLSLMMSAVHGGSEYARELFLNLHRTYYKKEYKALKRFSSISASELKSLARPEDKSSSTVENLARILCIADMSGIAINPDCNYLYRVIEDCWEKAKPSFEHSLPEVIGEPFKSCLREIGEYEQKKLYKEEAKVAKFLGNVFRWLGYNPSYADWCDENEINIERRYAITLAILRQTYPNKVFTIEEIAVYAAALHAASGLTCTVDGMWDILETLVYGPDGNDFFAEFPPLFNPANVRVLSATQPKETEKTQQISVPAEKSETPVYEESVLLSEIDRLRRKAHNLEAENERLRDDLRGRRKAEEEAKPLKEQLEAARQELAVLRSYVYGLTEEENIDTSASIDEMKERISGLRIVIIGGHANWIAKLKNEFPGWSFVAPSPSGSTDVSIVDKADHVYFFTDTISHSAYNRFIDVLRSRRIPYGYIHGVNLEKNIRYIFRDCFGD